MLVLNSKMVISVRLSIFYIFILPFVLCHIENHYPERRLSLGALYPASAADLEYRLPTDLKPTLYDLTLKPDLNKGTFTGTVIITFDVLKTTSTIVLNVNTDYIPLSGINASLINSSFTIDTYSEDKVHEMVFFNLSNPLTVGDTGVISISYSGILANDMLGFYLSTYKTSETTHLMAITQFESTYARRAFPCFDEPAYRAEFSVKIVRPTNMISLANMPLLQSNNTDVATGLILDTYQTSPPMPTYLVAFGVSDLAVKFTNETFRVFARPAAISDALYVDSVGPLLLDSIGNFTEIKYPLQKMDVVAVPDFDAGAMENWGLTTFREKYVLYNPNLNTRLEKFLVMSVVAHEFAHQWFGDLVTPELWDYAWLNEAFATYFEYTSNRWSPEWGSDDTMYIIEAVQYALGQDIGSPRPMTSPVYTPAQINNIFDYVIYEKGGSILRMTENFLTSAVWQKGLNTYLTNNNYSTGTPEKLFSALQEAAAGTSTGLTNVNETLQGWTTQPGYPLITVTLLSSNSTSSVYNITQKAYALDASYSGLTWNVPLTYTTQSEAQFDATKANQFWLLPSSPSTVNVNVNNSDWVIFNVNQVGFYRVNYDADNWSKLKAQLDSNFNAIGAINRAQIVDDAYQLARTGQLDYNTAFGLTAYLRNETELAPWNAFFTNMRYLLNQFYGTTTGDGLKQYAQQIMTNPFAELTSNLTVPLSTFLGSTTLLSAGLFSCDIELPECETLANSIFTNWRQNISVNVITPELKRTVFCTGLRLDTSVAAFTDVWNYYLASNNGAEKLTVMNALGCTSGADAINMYLDAVCNVSANNVRFQDRWIAFRALASRQSGVSLTLTYIAKNFVKFTDAVGPRYDSVIRAIANTISQPAHITQVQTLVNDSSVDQTLRNQLSSIVLPAVAKRQAWASSSQGASLKAWVDANTVKSSASSAVVNILLILMTVVSFIVHS